MSDVAMTDQTEPELPELPTGSRMGSGTINGLFVELVMHSPDALRAYATAARAPLLAEIAERKTAWSVLAAQVDFDRAMIERLRNALKLAHMDAVIAGTETAAYWTGMTDAYSGCMGRWQEALESPMPKPGVLGDERMERLYRQTEALRAERDVALDVLSSIWQYGADTLSGRVDGPDNRAWQRAAVVEITKRASPYKPRRNPLDQA